MVQKKKIGRANKIAVNKEYLVGTEYFRYGKGFSDFFISSFFSLETYRTVSSKFASNRIVHVIFGDPPRPNMNTFDGERNIPLVAAFDLKLNLLLNYYY